MTVSPPFSPATEPPARRLDQERVLFVGKLVSMTRPEACQLVLEHGGEVLEHPTQPATLVVIGDSQPDLATAWQHEKSELEPLQTALATGQAQLLREGELWERAGLVGEDPAAPTAIRRDYTPAMLAELLGVPVAAIRRWHRQGTLQACRSVRRLPYFDFTEVGVARHLATLYQAGCSLAVIDRRLAQLRKSLPEIERPLCNPAVVVSGKRLYLRCGEELTEPGGQLLIDFDKPDDSPTATAHPPTVLPLPGSEGDTVRSQPAADPCAPPLGEDWTSTEAGSDLREHQDLSPAGGESLSATDDPGSITAQHLHAMALEWEDLGELDRAAETYRTLLVTQGPSAELNFHLADLLYRLGDLAAARERYFAAIELDEAYVEARANLGCVLVELGELELAVAAFQGALDYHPDYADVHYHLAGALEQLGSVTRRDEARLHWQTFLALAPESPWAEMARERLETV